MKATAETLALLATHNARIPFNHWLGLEVIAANSTGIELKMPWRPEFTGAPGMTHGGILASLVDTTSFMVLLVANGAGGPTVDMRIDYHRSAVDTTLYAKGHLLHIGATISTVEATICDGEGRLIATGRCVFLTQPRISKQYNANPG